MISKGFQATSGQAASGLVPSEGYELGDAHWSYRAADWVQPNIEEPELPVSKSDQEGQEPLRALQRDPIEDPEIIGKHRTS